MINETYKVTEMKLMLTMAEKELELQELKDQLNEKAEGVKDAVSIINKLVENKFVSVSKRQTRDLLVFDKLEKYFSKEVDCVNIFSSYREIKALKKDNQYVIVFSGVVDVLIIFNKEGFSDIYYGDSESYTASKMCVLELKIKAYKRCLEDVDEMMNGLIFTLNYLIKKDND